MNLYFLAALRALLWPLFVWGDLGFYFRHAVFRKPNMGPEGDQIRFGKLFAITIVLLALGAALWLKTKTMISIDPNGLSVIAAISYLSMFVYCLTLNKRQHFAFNEKRWQFSFPAAFLSGMVMMVENQLVTLTQPELQASMARNYGVLVMIFTLFGAFAFKYRPKDMTRLQRKGM